MESVTCTAPVNIAVIKYWGKRNETLILPTNSSLSVTLCQDQLRAKTTVAMNRSFTEDKLWLNGKEQPMDNPRVQNVLREMRRRARKRKLSRDDEETGGCDWRDWHVHICSENNFPTAAGLASSAAGYACLVFALSKLFKIEGDISEIARRGSGSACRSIYGGFVEWDMGDKEDGSDSVARQVAPETHWPELRVLILVVSSKKKHIGSTAGMQTTVKTSDLLTHRVTEIVPQRMTAMKEAIDKKDFNSFAEITMKDSNQFHAVCLDTYPPISYMTDVSRDIIRIVHAVNKFYGTNKICYTYDAGPNACLYLLESDVALTLSIMQHFFPSPCENGDNYVKGLEVTPTELPNDLLSSIPIEPQKGAVQYIISTKAGCGPQVLGAEESLLGTDGLPKES